MNLIQTGNRCRTTSEYDPRVMRILGRMEGMKRWHDGKQLSFEATPNNLRMWMLHFPQSRIEQAIAEPVEPVDGPEIVSAPRPPFVYKTLPRAHQKRAVDKLYGLTANALLMDIGTGKSWTGITMMGRRWCEGLIDGVLLVAKNKVHTQWVKTAIPQHMSPSVRWKGYIWTGSQTRKDAAAWEAMRSFDGLQVFAINIDAIGVKVAAERIREFLTAHKGRVYMIVDESQDIKNQKAERTKLAFQYGAMATYRTIMTGTPLSKNVVDYFSQFKFLDERILGFRYITAYKGRYCEMQQTPWGIKITGHKNLDELYAKMEPYIFRITSDEALDLPPKVYDERPFSMSPEQRRLIRDLRASMLTKISDKEASASNAAGLVTKIQQISCGFLPMDDGTIEYFPSPRLEELENVLEQLHGKVIIWARFNEDVRLICLKLGKQAVHYYGKSTDAEKEVALRSFTDQNGARYFVASPEAAGTGLDGLQEVCHLNVYYSNSFNALARWQSEGRTWRDGTKHSAMYFDLIASGSPDRKILANLREKKSISDLTLDEMRKLAEFDED